MSRLFAGLAALALLGSLPQPAPAATSTPGSVDPVPAAPAPPPAAAAPATPPAASSPVAAPTPAPAPAATAPSTAESATPPAGETAAAPAKPEVKKKVKRRYARYGYYRYPYRGPFFYAHPRFWWPFYRPRYRYYRHPRRYYYGPPFPFYIFRW